VLKRHLALYHELERLRLAGLRDERGALERHGWSVVKMLCLDPVILPPAGSQGDGIETEQGATRSASTNEPAAARAN
jgi:hypothetical protein